MCIRDRNDSDQNDQSIYNDSSIKWNVLFDNHNFQIMVFQLIHFKWGLNGSVADKADVGI